MPKGDNRSKAAQQKLNEQDKWLHGESKQVTQKRGKDQGMTRKVYSSDQRTYRPVVEQKGDFDYKGDTSKGAEKFVAGANILDAKGKETKRKSFKEHMKSGGRANDPRNWEFHYKDPSQGGRKRWTQTKGMSAQERKDQAYKNAKMSAQKQAKLTGKQVYEIQQIEYETQGVIQESDAAMAKSKAIGGAGAFGSTRVAANVAAQKARSNRKSGPGRGQATTAGAFDKQPKTNTQRIA